jgi:hypothetical protein
MGVAGAAGVGFPAIRKNPFVEAANMAVQDYIPHREDELIAWFNNFATKITTYQAVLGLTAAEVSEVQAENLVVHNSILAVELARNEAREWVTFKNLEIYGPIGGAMPSVPSTPTPAAISPRAPGILIRTRALVTRIKAHPAYTAAMGADLGLIGPEESPPTEIKPTGSAVALPNFAAEIKFVKRRFDGVDIEGQRGSEMTWTYLAFDSSSPYIDNRPPVVANQTEQRRYRMRYRDSDVPVGVFSDTLTVTVGQ